MKKCYGCREELEETEYYKRKSGKIFSKCKRCTLAVSKKRYAEHRDRVIAGVRRWQERNRETHLANVKRYGAENREAINKKRNERRRKKREKQNKQQ